MFPDVGVGLPVYCGGNLYRHRDTPECVLSAEESAYPILLQPKICQWGVDLFRKAFLDGDRFEALIYGEPLWLGLKTSTLSYYAEDEKGGHGNGSTPQ